MPAPSLCTRTARPGPLAFAHPHGPSPSCWPKRGMRASHARSEITGRGCAESHISGISKGAGSRRRNRRRAWRYGEEKRDGACGGPSGRLSPQGPAWLPCWFRSRRRSGTGKVRSAGPGTRKPPPKAQRSPAPWKKGPQPMLRSTAIQDSKLMSGRSSSLLRRVYGLWKISRADCVRHCTKRKEGHSLFPGIPVVLSGLIARRPVLCVRSRAGYAERRGNAPWADLVSGIYF